MNQAPSGESVWLGLAISAALGVVGLLSWVMIDRRRDREVETSRRDKALSAARALGEEWNVEPHRAEGPNGWALNGRMDPFSCQAHIRTTQLGDCHVNVSISPCPLAPSGVTLRPPTMGHPADYDDYERPTLETARGGLVVEPKGSLSALPAALLDELQHGPLGTALSHAEGDDVVLDFYAESDVVERLRVYVERLRILSTSTTYRA